ncbi:MAG: T9SS type A sorting domain-containing protein [Bacteroidales bacterium]|nr:T9SS type A sorting domain-containing protein [Bacteroidales bacterium]
MILLSVCLAFSSQYIHAQDTLRSLVITEARLSDPRFAYIELTNTGEEVLDLHNWEFGRLRGTWYEYHIEPHWIILGDYIDSYGTNTDTILEPGRSIWMTLLYESPPEYYTENRSYYFEDLVSYTEQQEADIVFHARETPSISDDSISAKWEVMDMNPYESWYIRYHLPNGDSVVTDQVGNEWSLFSSHTPSIDVAGIRDAMYRAVLVRKFGISEGVSTFNDGRGSTLDESDWIPLLLPQSGTINTHAKHMFWTAGNHGNYSLDATTLRSSTIEIDWDNHILNVPWGTFNGDSVMMRFDYHPGLAWNYKLNTDTTGGENWEQAHHDSAFVSARTGDTLIVWAAGNELDEIRFHINVLPPEPGDNRIIPKVKPGYEKGGWYGTRHKAFLEVTNGAPGMDTILDIPYATRKDTMLKYFEKAPDATWEFADGMGNRPDVVNGDMLRVTAENGSVKEYFVDVEDYLPGHNAALSSITWPDIPSTHKNMYGFKGDTIGDFSPDKYNYKVTVPLDAQGIPALTAKTEDINARVEVERATHLYSTLANRTITFSSFAEDDTTVLVYKVHLEKEKDSVNIQPWKPDPFLSQYVFQDQWGNNFMEICNPGPAPLDLSKYIIVNAFGKDPFEMITRFSSKLDWADRYSKYIPGHKWRSESDWQDHPGICEPDPTVNPIIDPGDVFVMGTIRTTGQSGWTYNEDWWVLDELDVNFADLEDPVPNHWGERIAGQKIGTLWSNSSWFMFKILNDSVRQGLKPANDPDDFELIETWAGPNEGDWIIGGRSANADNQTVTWIRKPQFYQGRTGLGESFGTQVDNGTRLQDGTSEWLCYDQEYGANQGYYWPEDILYITRDLGQHEMDEVTMYLSTIASRIYKVSLGYSMDESIRGVITGTTVKEFYGNIIKKDENQTLKVVSEGDSLSSEAVLSDRDSLYVCSADGINTTRYRIEVTDDGMSNDALLTSSVYTIKVDGNAGTVEGFDHGTPVSEVFDNVALPSGAQIDIIDEKGAYVPLQQLNFQNIYVPTQVSDQVFFLVTAEDGITQIAYQLKPNSTSSDAFVYSDVYEVNQEVRIITGVADNTSVRTLYSNMFTSAGAVMQVKDKAGYNRFRGTLYKDDMLTVTAEDGITKATYYFTFLTGPGGCESWAYVLSDVYTIDQLTGTITHGSEAIDPQQLHVNEFLANLFYPNEAVVEMYDGEGNIKGGNELLEKTDTLRVSVCDGKVFKDYHFDSGIWESVNEKGTGMLAYPNPGSGIFTVDGLEPGSTIQVFSFTGRKLIDRKVQSKREMLSLEHHGSGLYFLVIRNDKGPVGHFKLIIE